MIEALWKSMKHGWLFLHQLDTFATLEKLIPFYVEQHNSVVPHSAFAGQTPDEMYFGRGDQVPVDLAAGRACAREARMKSNRDLSCKACLSPTVGEQDNGPAFSRLAVISAENVNYSTYLEARDHSPQPTDSRCVPPRIRARVPATTFRTARG
jgi:hypothetical protein